MSEESTSESSSDVRNSATEISTDSEFAHDDPTPTRERPPPISFNDHHVTKTRGSRGTQVRKMHVTTGYLQRPSDNGKAPPKRDIQLNLSPLVPSAPSIVRKPVPVLLPRTEGYALNRTQSTGGIAAKVSLELKKRYLLGEAPTSGSIQKSGSASTLDSKLKSFTTNITECQKLLKTAPEVGKTVGGPSPVLKISDVSPIPTIPEKKIEYHFENEPEGRPRSPVHETSIIVPTINWSKNTANQSEDSLSIDSISGGEQEVPKIIPTVVIEPEPLNIPAVTLDTELTTEPSNLGTLPSTTVEESLDKIEQDFDKHPPESEEVKPDINENPPPIDDFPPDSLCTIEETQSITSVTEKSISSEKKSLNQPKLLPQLKTNILPEIHSSLHIPKTATEPTDSDADSIGEQATAALTETELSDWARDGAVSDDLEGVEFDLNREPTPTRLNKQTKMIDDCDVKGKSDSDGSLGHVCGRNVNKNKIVITEALNSVLSQNLDIEFMDTGTETSSDDGVADSQNGYVLFKDEDELIEDSLNPVINEIIEAKNEVSFKNTGYCVLAEERHNFGSEVIDLKPSDLEKFKTKQNLGDPEDDSLLILDTGTTTEENTCSDSTVKNLTEFDTKLPPSVENNNFQRKRLEDKLAKLKAEQVVKQQPPDDNREKDNVFYEPCQRLQSTIDFGNAKDSIDVRKSRRKSKLDAPQKPDLILEESPNQAITLKLTPTIRTPDVLYKKEEIEKERDVNQKLIQEMVMNKMKAENKSLDRKKRKSRPFELTKSATTDIVSEINRNNIDNSGSSVYVTPDVLLSTLKCTSDSFNTSLSPTYPLDDRNSMPDVKRALFAGDFKTPIAPPRLKHEEAKKTAEKMKQDARVRARLLSNEELGLSPEDKLLKLREKIVSKKEGVDFIKTERHDSTPSNILRKTNKSKAGANLLASRTKSIGEIAETVKPLTVNICKSDPNLLNTDSLMPKKKSKDRERRKSISKMISNLFSKKSPSGNSKGIFSRMSPKAKDLSKVCLFYIFSL